ncbi:LytTR family DNA-binding domain-containing protein [Flavivirga abyssicola]|uniref:LytR/AlgR family response regulator transcription factor n=1 Tax=Flavivirga TaxID=1209327 RepID=UPI001FE383E1|nr:MULTISPECIES: LytTR family DNA-binding domain-containing protein [Flavivirga]WVK14279.1 LytTR family DNA-binding domain-containing protein [Flavivirga sp. MEBiC07777]
MSNLIKALIIDDESLARKRISNLLSDIKEIEVLEECSSGKEAINAISNKKPDLIFLDIQITDMTGFDVLKQIDPLTRPLIIFITAFDEFALKAFDFFAFDYLLKPFKDERFFQSTNKVIELLTSNKSNILNRKISDLLRYIENPNEDFPETKKTKLAIRANGKISFIEKNNIKYIQASGYYAEIFTEHKKFLLRESLNSLLDQLKPYNFARIHRSTIINTSFISEVLYSNYGEIDVKMQDEKLFRISKTYKKEFQKKMGI